MSVGVLSCVTIIAQTLPHRYLFNYLFSLIIYISLFNYLVTQSIVEQLLFEYATFSESPLFKDSLYFVEAVTFSQEPLFQKILFQSIYFFTPNLVSTATFSIYQLVSNPINIGVFKP